MKKTLLIGLMTTTLMSGTAVFAEDRDEVKVPKGPLVTHVNVDELRDSERHEKMMQKNSNSLSRLKAKAEHLIDSRIKDLNNNNKIIKKEKLTDEQKAYIGTQVSTNITGLTALKASIASSTDATSTKALVESIYTKFRIYGIVIPQIRLEKRIYELQNHVTKLSESFVKFQNKINEYKGKGKDVTVWQKSLDDAKLMVASDVGKLNALLLQTQALKPSDYGTSSKATIDAINVGIKAVAKDFHSIERSLRKPHNLTNASTTVIVNSTSTVNVNSTTTIR